MVEEKTVDMVEVVEVVEGVGEDMVEAAAEEQMVEVVE